MDPDGATIRFQLSAQHSPQGESQQPAAQGATAELPVLEPAAVHVYSGPGCYVKPKGKTNLKIIRNALCAVCLAGEVNLTLKQKTLYVSG